MEDKNFCKVCNHPTPSKVKTEVMNTTSGSRATFTYTCTICTGLQKVVREDVKLPLK